MQDPTDIRALVDAQRDALDWRNAMRSWLPPAEATVLRAVADSTDEELVRRLLG